MEDLSGATLTWSSWGAWLVVVVAGATWRSRAYAIFRAIVLGLYTLIALPLLAQPEGFLHQVALYCHAAVYLDSLLLVRPRLRPLWYRVVLSWPAMYFAACMLLAFPWAIVAGFGLTPHGYWIPFVLGTFGLVQSLSTRLESHAIDLRRTPTISGVQRASRELQRLEADPAPAVDEPLRIVQITDPHLGPFMSVRRLERICRRAVEREPDLVLLTGDFLTMESQADAQWLTAALWPLKELPGRVFACMGNHDHEAPEVVARALKGIGCRLLIDDCCVAHTRTGDVQIVGFDFHFRDRKARMEGVCQSHPRLPNALRLGLIHDPGAFRHCPPGDLDLAVSGHTHGGQVGLVSLGIAWTVAGWIAKIPDYGFWGHGTSRLYVHRGTGHYGFPLRLGVPAEESLLLIRSTPTTVQ